MDDRRLEDLAKIAFQVCMAQVEPGTPSFDDEFEASVRSYSNARPYAADTASTVLLP